MSEQATAAVEEFYEEVEAGPGWHIGDIESLDWALSRIADLQREIAENERVAEAAKIRIDSRTALLNARAVRGVEFFEGRIREYALLHRKDLLGGGKKKSRTLAHGSVGWRNRGGGFKCNDKDSLLAWARQQPVELGFVRLKEEADWSAIKAYCETSGEVPPGVDVEPEAEELQVKAISLEAANGDR